MRRGSEETDRGASRRGPGPVAGLPTDGGTTVVLEAIVAVLVIVGAVIFLLVATTPQGSTGVEGDDELETLARDALRTLTESGPGVNESRRTPVPLMVADAVRGNGTELDRRIGELLPAGAQANVFLGNGEAEMTLVRNGPAPEESVGAQQPISPPWPVMHVVPDLAVYPSDQEVDMNVTGLPLWASNPLDRDVLEEANVTFENDHEAPLEDDGRAHGSRANATITNETAAGGDGFPVEDRAEVTSNVTHRNESLDGFARYETDGASVVGNAHDDARSGLGSASVEAVPDDVEVGGVTTIEWNLTPVANAVDEHLLSGTTPEVFIGVYRPLPRDDPVGNGSAAFQEGGLSQDGSVDVPVDDAEILGRWLVLAQLNYTLDDGSADGLDQEARLVTDLVVRLPESQGDPIGVYDLQIEAWYEDW